jgi:sensor histidine kinase YesM
MSLKIFHTRWNSVIISSLAISIAVITAVQFTFTGSEQLLVQKTTNLLSANLSKDNTAISDMLYDAQKVSAIISTNSNITRLLSVSAQGRQKHSFLDYSVEDLNRITQLESIVTNYRNTVVDYQMHVVILGMDGSLYSVLDGVGNRYQFASNFMEGLRKQAWFRKFLGSDQNSLWKAPYYYDNSTGVPLEENGYAQSHILFCRKIFDYYSQQELGVAVVSVLGDNLRQKWFGRESFITGLLNSNGDVIYSSGQNFDTAYQGVSASLHTAGLPDEDSSYTVLRDKNGESFVLTYSTLPFEKWRLVNLMPLSSITQEIKLMRNNTYTIDFLVLLAAVLSCALMLTYIMRPYNRILKKMNRMHIGDVPVGAAEEKIISVPDAERKFDQMADHIEKMTAAALEKQKLEAKMQYETLRAQLDPHFLFNTLNTIKWSAMASNAGNIADMIACLGRLLESAMRRGEEDIPLFRELEMVESYMQIKNWTLKYRYELKVQVPECFFNYPVFKYCLQPIVENAIVHGMEGMENGVVTIRARRENGFLLLEVHNNGKEMSPEQISQVLLQVRSASDSKRTLTGVGLSSIDGMVKLRYGKEYGILIDSGPGRGTTVTVSLPYRETDERRENRNAGDDKGPDCR